MFTTFDGPTGEACLVKRETSNTALQALTALNDIIVTEAAQALGRQLGAGPVDDAGRIKDLYLRVLCRAPDKDEQALMAHFVRSQRSRLQKGDLDAATIAGIKSADALEAAVWTLTTRALFNLDEFVTKG
jgi:hypothetical protein